MNRTVRRLRHTARRHQLRVGRMLARMGLPDYTIFTVFSLLMGMAAGFAGVGLHEVIGWLSAVVFGSEHIAEGGRPAWFLVGIPAAGMLVQALMVRGAPGPAAHRGVQEVIKAVGLRHGRIPLRTTLFHFLAPAVCIGTGGTVGPEAPAAQSGAGAASALGQVLGLSPSRRRVFTAAGAGAAISAIFNTPLAGVFFALEVVLLQDFKVWALSAFLLASVAASTVSRLLLGNAPQFVIESLQIGSYRLYVFYLLLGLAAGVLSIAFIRANEGVRAWYGRRYRRLPREVGMVATGLLMGLAGLWQPGIFGIGYQTMDRILAGALPPDTVALLVGLKFVLVLLILGAGGFGGVFAPSLFIGGGVGYLFALGAGALFGVPLDPATYTLVGMGAMLAGVNSVPLTGIMILFELTNDYHFILPLMLGVVGSTMVVQMVLKGSIHVRELEREGYHPVQGHDARLLAAIPVSRAMRKDILLVPESTTLATLIQECLDRPHTHLYTTDATGRLNGVILPATLHQLMAEYQNVKSMIVAQDLADPLGAVLRDTDTLETALHLFTRLRVDELPVVRAHDPERVCGTLHYQDLLAAYNQATTRCDLVDDLAGDLTALAPGETREVIPGFAVARVPLPPGFAGKTLKHLRLRNRFDVDVLMIERPSGDPVEGATVEPLYPRIADRLQEGDQLLIFGQRARVEAFRRLAGAG